MSTCPRCSTRDLGDRPARSRYVQAPRVKAEEYCAIQAARTRCARTVAHNF
ncbi:hypothetical protein ABZ383_26425 [Streptomyces sp. NPDC005900]|uniref:hypothetical protein n=1 Tax=Streptomyces sp. NPDC005900 TaxID=3154569 RepID=UPI0033EE6E4C